MAKKHGCPPGKRWYDTKCVDAKMVDNYRKKQKEFIDPAMRLIFRAKDWCEAVGFDAAHDNLDKALDLIDM